MSEKPPLTVACPAAWGKGSQRCPQLHQLADDIQTSTAPATSCATLLVLTISPTPDSGAKIKSALGGIGELVQSVKSHAPSSPLTVTIGIGSRAWDGITGSQTRPAELHEFVALSGDKHTAPSTPGDLFFHIRAERQDMCFEMEHQLLIRLGDMVDVVDSTSGFKYFDDRDLLGFVDGSANPVGPHVAEDVLVTGDQDSSPLAHGGSYLLVQKYIHDIAAWEKLSIQDQESIIGRTKQGNEELPDQPESGQKPHKQLATIVDAQGEEHDILRDNMPFGNPGEGEFGTYFIGYARHLWVIEKMLERMFKGDPPGKYDRILDYSKAMTGSVFFVPSAKVLESFGRDR